MKASNSLACNGEDGTPAVDTVCLVFVACLAPSHEITAHLRATFHASYCTFSSLYL